MSSELDNAKEMVELWREALKAAAAGNKSYTVNGRSIMRYSLAEIRKEFNYWQAEVDRITIGMTSQVRVSRIIPWG